MKDEQQTGLPNSPGPSPEGSKGTGSRDVRWTPGPWKVIRGKVQAYRICPDDFTTLALVYGLKSPPAPNNGEANALLIAAAPELYEALEDVERMFTSFPLLAGANSGKLSRIRAVLAKARGEL